jgi:hypothetical protein
MSLRDTLIHTRDNVVADLFGRAVVAALLFLAGGIYVAVEQGGTIPVWILAATVAVFILAFAAGAALVAVRHRRLKRDEEIAWFAVDVEEQFLQHLSQVLDTLQQVLRDGVGPSEIADFVNHGILAPARDMLTRHAHDCIRLSVLSPHGEDFVMDFWAGHNLTSAKKFRIARGDSMSSVAFSSGKTETWDDVTEDDRFKHHPLATRPTRAMLSVPLTRGDDVIGVFNAISDRPHGFLPADHLYLECLGSVIDVAVGILLSIDQQAGDQSATVASPSGSERKGTA